MSNDSKYIDIVFDGPPAAESGRFVEVENPDGASIRVGEWIERPNGMWALRLTPKDTEQALYEMPRTPGWYLDKNGDVIRVNGDRYRRPGQHSLNDFHFREFAPFVRLVPETAADV